VPEWWLRRLSFQRAEWLGARWMNSEMMGRRRRRMPGRYPPSFMLRLRPWAVAERGLCLKHRWSNVDNDIVGNRISSNPQKLQAILATVKIGSLPDSG
jgi:hypothetical protein